MSEKSQVIWQGKNFKFDLTDEAIIYSIVNCTPDSFYAGSQYHQVSAVLKKVADDLENGAAVIELGGKSTRPNHQVITAEEEWQRIKPALQAVKSEFPDTVLAVDTDSADVMKWALDEYGVDIINDVTSLNEPEKLAIVEQYQPSIVLMESGQNNSANEALNLGEYFTKRIEQFADIGIAREQICIDPGIGFSFQRDVHEDMMRIKMVQRLAEMNVAIMAAISRKSFIGKRLDLEVDERLMPTLLFEMLMVRDGARVLRVHDVKETKQMLEVLKYYDEVIL
jgi:dihydropteroate synthase